ncbi:Gryzun, putative trafficking through golgi-domain-containing protein [Pilobolus umbonatus]|nr:Gryzun, putative trafficking through golgi-domain-containing protein [Pilobolus umbonatus]
MYSYPSEYLLHPVPVLAIYGLSATDEPSLLDQPTNVDIVSPSRRGSHTKAGLSSTLLNLLLSKSEYSLHEATSHLSNQQAPPFRVISVSKDYMLPNKISSTSANMPPPHSNLSPLSSESPLFPDGVMTSLWIKKHLYSPSVIVGFYDLWDWNSEPGNAPRPRKETGPLASQILIDPIERENDTHLSVEINNRRKYFQERNVKFAAVIVSKQKYTADPSIEERLLSIRKQCGLDSKNSFFTVAPASTSELQEFVNSLYRALYEPALQFYSNRIKKLRKKKSRLPSPNNIYKAPLDFSSTSPQPLPVSGWIARYDFKISFFYECRQEIDLALRSYEATYNTLLTMLEPKPSGIYGPMIWKAHSKRWKEARALADCINIKLCRFYLYLNDPTAALDRLNTHLHMFQSYASVWGIGGETFEYWSWHSLQYQIFADIIDAAVSAGFQIPLPTAYLTSSQLTSTTENPLMANTTTGPIQSGGCNPETILQHPGFYYHLAAMCCAERRRRYLEMEKAETRSKELTEALAEEKQTDHSNLTIDLLTKSYEQFKRYRNSRMTLYLAAEIAGAYYEAGKFEMAIKFFERIGKIYRKEKWNMVLTSILRWSLRCAKELCSWERAVECLIELLSDELPMPENKRKDVERELMEILQTNPNANLEEHPPLTVYMDQINSFLKCQVQFQKQKNFVGTRLHYQIILATDKSSPPLPFRINSMRITFNDPQYNVIIRDNVSSSVIESLELIDCRDKLSKITEDEYSGWYLAEANLGIKKSQTKVIQGSLVPAKCGELKITGIYLDIIKPKWRVELNYSMEKPVEDQPLSRRKWMDSIKDGKPVYRILEGRGELSTTSILPKPPSIDLRFDHAAPALLDELFKLNVNLTSHEKEAISVILSVSMKHSEGTVMEDYVVFSSDLEKGDVKANSSVQLGKINPGESIVKSVYLHGGKSPGSRIVNFQVKYNIVGKEESQLVEKEEHIRIPFVNPFDANFELCAQCEKLNDAICPDLGKSERWLLVAAIRCFSAWDLVINSVELLKSETSKSSTTSMKLISEVDNIQEQVWKTGHVYNANYLFQLNTDDITEAQLPVSPGKIVIKWKRSGTEGIFNKSILHLPTIQFQEQGLKVLADLSNDIYQGEPFTITYTIDNPTEYLAEYSATIELSEAFVFSGYKQVKGRVLPLSRMKYQYTCYPLLVGKVKLPQIKVMALQHQGPEKEIYVEMLGTGNILALDNDLQLRQMKSSELISEPIVVFVNAKRYL